MYTVVVYTSMLDMYMCIHSSDTKHTYNICAAHTVSSVSSPIARPALLLLSDIYMCEC